MLCSPMMTNALAMIRRFGHAGLNGQNMGSNSAEDIFRNFGDIFGSDIFGDLFGFGGGGGGGGGRSGPRKGESLGYRLEVDFLEAALGCEKKFQFLVRSIAEIATELVRRKVQNQSPVICATEWVQSCSSKCSCA